MKRILLALTVVIPSISALLSSGFAAEVTTASSPPANAAQVQNSDAVIGLPYGVADVLKLSRASVGDDIIISYIRNTGTIYNLKPETIIYLKDQGLSDKVLDAMLHQPAVAQGSGAGTTSTWANQPAPQNSTAAQPPQQQVAPAYTQPPVQDPPRSTVHVIEHYPAFPIYSGYYYGGYGFGYPGVYSYWGSPRLSIGLGFGWGFGGHHHHRW